MNILEKFYRKVIRYDLVNKFSYTKVEEIPKLKKIVLNFGCKNFELKNIASALLSLELITTKRGSLTRAKRSNILLKIREGYPVGCVVILKKTKMYDFFLKLLVQVFPNLKVFEGISTSKKSEKISFSFTLKDLISFKELEKQFYLFSKLPPLNITIFSNAKTKKEMLYLMQSFKLPLVF